MHQDASPAAASAAFDAALRAEQIPYLYQLLPNLIGASIAVGAVLAIASLEHAAKPALLGWAAAMCVALLLRLPLLAAWRRAGAAALDRRWLWAFRGAIFITSGLWGIGAVLMYHDAPADFRAMLVMTIAGMGAASAASMAVDRVSAFGFTVVALPPLLVLLFLGGSSLDYSLALLMLLGAIFVVLGVLRTHTLLVENIRLRLDSAAQALALRDSEARWRFALEGGGDGVADCDLRTGRAAVSRRWRELEARLDGPTEIALCDWAQSIHPDDRARAQAEFQRALGGAENCTALECRIGSEAGGWRWVAMRAMVVSRRADGKALRVIATRTDIDEQKRTFAALLESRERLQLIFDATTDGLVLRDRHGRVLECNAAALRILGLTSAQIGDEEPLPAGWRILREDGSEVPLDQHPTARALRTGQPVSATVMGLSAPGREVRWISTTVIPLLDADGQVSVLVTSYADVSARVLAEQRLDRRNQELEQASREARALADAKSTFLANISHEIRSPLAAILGYADRALARGEDLAALRKALDTTQRSARHLLQIVNDVLDAAQLDAGQLHIAASEADAMAVSADVVDLLGPVAEAKQLYLRLHAHWPLPRLVQADPLRLKQVLVNLVGNALKFTERGGVLLDIGADAERQRLWILVSDSGIGMSSEQLQRLFQPFTQGDASHSRRYGGTGLGLYISAELMRRMGGSIAVEHSTPAGSRLRIELPMRAEVPWIHAPQSVLPAGPPQRPCAHYQGRVLLVEDDPFLQALTIAWLEDRGLAVDAVDDGLAALKAARDRAYDLILMDMHMPGLDGHGATLALRAAGCQAPIIALTADMLPASVQAHRQAGCTAVLGKPVSLEELDAMLGRHLRQPVAESA